MKLKIAAIFAILLTALMLLAQDTAQIFSELQQAAPAGRELVKPAVTPVAAPTLAPVVMPAEPVVRRETVVESAPAVVEVAPVAKTPAVVEAAPAPIAAVSAAAPEDVVETVIVSAEPATGGTIKAGLISVSLKEVELSNVIRLFSTLSDANIIVPELEAGIGAVKVDVNLKEVEWKPALQAILEGQNLELYEKIASSQVYSIRKKLPASDAVRNTRTFLFKNADIKQAYDMLTGMVGGRGQVYAYPQGNSIVVKTSQEIMDDVAQIAERIDTARRQVLIEARILELSDTKQHDRGVDWSDPNGGGLLKRAISFSAGTNSGGNILFDQKELGGAFNQRDTLTLDAGQLRVLMSALDQIADVQTVSSPKVIVANGEKATIKIVRKEPVILSTPTFSTDGNLQSIIYNQDPDGTDPITTRKRYATYDYGIMLDVTPTIYSDENVGVHIVPTISRLYGTKDLALSAKDAANSPVQSFPIIDEKKVDTTFMLANKQTAVIGGLTETTKQDKESKVPILSSIPLIRQLFTYTHTEDVQLENVIFVTVTLEDGKKFDLDRANKKSPLTRKQLIREEGNQTVDDRDVELFKAREDDRVKEDVRIIEQKGKVESRDRTLRKPFWSFLRP